jgi:hypothetical protein
MKTPPASLFLALGLAACATSPERAVWIGPAHAAQLAAAAEGRPVHGVFALTVQAVDSEHGRTFLNSERDYRDPRNISLVLQPDAARSLATRLGMRDLADLRGRQLLVLGHVRRVRIDFTQDGRPTGKYYYQSHVAVHDAAQLQLR